MDNKEVTYCSKTEKKKTSRVSNICEQQVGYFILNGKYDCSKVTTILNVRNSRPYL